MAVEHGYVDLEDLKDELGSNSRIGSTGAYERAIAAASRWIDRHCQRHFWLTDAPVMKPIRPTSRMVLSPGDFPTTDSMSVAVRNADGSFSTLPGDAWQAEPFHLENGWPYRRITPTGAPVWAVDPFRPTVQVTAFWGWSAIPPEVSQAATILAVAYMLGKDVISNQDGYSLGSSGPTDPIGLAQHLLEPFTPEMTLERFAEWSGRKR